MTRMDPLGGTAVGRRSVNDGPRWIDASGARFVFWPDDTEDGEDSEDMEDMEDIVLHAQHRRVIESTLSWAVAKIANGLGVMNSPLTPRSRLGSYGMTTWETHVLCDTCWSLINDHQPPHRVRFAGRDTCCSCRVGTVSGIFVRHPAGHPQTLTGPDRPGASTDIPIEKLGVPIDWTDPQVVAELEAWRDGQLGGEDPQA